MLNEKEKIESLRRYKGRKKTVQGEYNNSDTEKLVIKTVNGKTVVINKKLEEDQKLSDKTEKTVVFICFAVVFCIVACVVFSALHKNGFADEVALLLDKESKISESGNYKFGKFEGFVTVGDSLEDTADILGLPDKIVEDMYYFGNSYLLIDNNTVVGYYKEPSDDFRVTVGFKEVDGKISKGDNAARVVSLLGSPTYYLKHEWIYENVSRQFEYINYDGIAIKLTVHFDQNYKVTGYVFSE